MLCRIHSCCFEVQDLQCGASLECAQWFVWMELLAKLPWHSVLVDPYDSHYVCWLSNDAKG
jgi:hypothetical protein